MSQGDINTIGGGTVDGPGWTRAREVFAGVDRDGATTGDRAANPALFLRRCGDADPEMRGKGLGEGMQEAGLNPVIVGYENMSGHLPP